LALLDFKQIQNLICQWLQSGPEYHRAKFHCNSMNRYGDMVISKFLKLLNIYLGFEIFKVSSVSGVQRDMLTSAPAL